MSVSVSTAKLNLILLAAANAANLLLLYVASHAPWWGTAVAAALFALSNNTMFALLHESVHGSFAPDRRLNAWCGRLLVSHRLCRAAHVPPHPPPQQPFAV